MTGEVLERGTDGEPTAVFYRESAEESAERIAERTEQSERARELAESYGHAS